ncbi:hypothetical protein [Bradyrhizobium sp. NAS80.1]|uniref:hypothetical protein n=1 Tax=Bradyrhizobium sp. NAS80.1 TaxID=1680159 RepID=UPI00116136E9|nr:hypothetical protein [Bradyrhizobium sp. NAS80.1]
MISKTRIIPIDTHSEMARSALGSMMRANRKWPISYRSIEAMVICGDLFAILIASILSTLLFPAHGVWTATDIGRAIGSAIVVSALCVSLLKTRGMHTPAELLDLGHQVHAVCLCWAVVFLLLAAAVSALNLGSELFHGAGATFAVVGLVMLIGQRVFVRALVLKGLSERKFSGGKYHTAHRSGAITRNRAGTDAYSTWFSRRRIVLPASNRRELEPSQAAN